MRSNPLTHLQRLESESIQILREAVSESEKPVMLYSVGKDSAVMLHLAKKAFYPSPPPFPLLHIDTTWKFKAMYEFRDQMAAESRMELLVYQNPEAVRMGINPFDHGSARHTDRVFPLSNWTELDVWQYIHHESIPIVPLYFADVRPVVERDGTLIMVDDDRMPVEPGEIEMRSVRFRTLGCYPLTGAVESTASTLPEIIQEMLLTTSSERQGRVIDHDSSASMEKKKQEGYF